MAVHVLAVIMLIYIAIVDAKTMEIPDQCNVILGIFAVISLWCNPEIGLQERIIGAFCISVPMYALCILIEDAFGGGDIKLVFVSKNILM